MDAAERAALAKLLRDEAFALLSQTGLPILLARKFGEVVVTGSAGYDLMVWRDIDIHMPVPKSEWRNWMALGTELADALDSAGLVMHRGTYWNDYVDPHPLGAGLYWGIEFRDAAGQPWKSDIWGWDPPDFDRRQARDEELRANLRTADRDLILRLKHQARDRQGYYGPIVGSMDIYRFALANAGTTLDELEAWKAAAGTVQ